ncbi:PepSY domain-containing protein [Paenochrobactrum sp. BZR 588]|uniref:PepSY domain-containing protein n=1 Tax=Paenochrobactrum TaxID=999488 RepID=UPI0035BC010D
MRTLLISLFLLMPVSTLSAAEPDGKKLSEIIAEIEQNSDFSYIDEIDWDRKGYYEIEYYLKTGAKVEVRIDPKTGAIVPR